jgi:hypothetical protein
MSIEATEGAAPAATDSATSTTAAPAAPATQEPSQEAILSELRTAKKEERPVKIDGLGGNPAPANPAAQPKHEDTREAELQKKFGSEYRDKQERAIAQTSKYKTKLDAMSKRIEELEGKWNEAAKWKKDEQGNRIPDNQYDFIKDNLEYETLKKDLTEKTAEYDDKVAEYREGIKSELSELYNTDATFKAQNDHYYEMIFKKLEGAEKFCNAVMESPDRIAIMRALYDWLDNNPAQFNGFIAATPEARMTALGMMKNQFQFKPRVVAPAPAAPAPISSSPAAPPQVKAPSINPNPAGVGGGSFDMDNQEDVQKYFRQRQKELDKRFL